MDDLQEHFKDYLFYRCNPNEKKKTAKLQNVGFSSNNLKIKWGINTWEALQQSSQDFREDPTELIRRQ